MRPNPDFSDLFAALNGEAVEYLLVGGYALAVHAAPRHLRQNKRASGRAQDLADLELLEKYGDG